MAHVNMRNLGEGRVAIRLQRALYPVSTVNRMPSMLESLVPVD